MVADFIPTVTSYRSLWNPHTNSAGGVNLAENKELFYRYLYYSGFDEKEYATQLNATGRTLTQIGDEMQHLRISTVDLFESFTEEMLARKGTANSNELSVVALGINSARSEFCNDVFHDRR